MTPRWPKSKLLRGSPIAFLLALWIGAGAVAQAQRLNDLHTLEELRTTFNHHPSTPRLILLLSPT